ncbi:protein interacting with cyclin A1 [Rhinolophus ferrumequinum]|uniref:Protein interacting with cyclin A1 n=1 Tax=Rhinolophus ferrumequinum TaxID=59479 RepID=A0A7J7TFW6_RHIFE|nr:protein interacting with cyclin A1 [Rhinolophus ferrumequinum]
MHHLLSPLKQLLLCALGQGTWYLCCLQGVEGRTLEVNSRTVTGAVGNTSSALGTSSAPSPLTVATTTCICTLLATATVILGAKATGLFLWQ